MTARDAQQAPVDAGAAGPRELAIAGAAYLLVALVLFADVVFGDARFIARDLLHYFYPFSEITGAALAGDGSLLWDGSVAHGLPYLARWTPGVFYPANWLGALLPASTAFAIGILAHLVLGALACFALARRYARATLAAWIAGLGFGFGGYLLAMIGGAGVFLYGAALLPLSLLALHRLCERPRLGRALELALVVALQVFVADAQTLFYEALLWPLIIWFHPAPADRRRALLLAGAAGAVALLLACCQLLPSLRYGLLSVRAAGLSYAEAATWGFHPARLLELLVPGVFGQVAPENLYWARGLVNGPHNNPWASSTHVGLLLTCGAAIALAAIRGWPARGRVGARHDRCTLLLAGLVVLFAALACGEATPLHRLVHALPGAATFRYPEKFMLFVSLGLCLLGARGLDALLRSDSSPGEDRRPARVALAALGIVAAACLVAWIGLRPGAEADVRSFAAALTAQGARVDPGKALDLLTAALLRGALFAGLLFAVVALRGRLRSRLPLVLLVLISVVELLTAGRPNVLVGDAAWVEADPATCKLLPAGAPAPFVWRLRVPFRPHAEDRGLGRVEALRRHHRATLKANIGHRCARYARGYVGAKLAAHERLYAALARRPGRLMGLLGVRYVIAAPGDPRLGRLRPSARLPRHGVAVYPLARSLPYLHPVSRVRVVASAQRAIELLAEGALRYHEELVFEGRGPLRAEPPARRRARLLRQRAGDLTVSTSFDEPGYLMVQETFYPGWRAELDGRPLKLWRANGLFIGLRIPAGEHRLHLRFAPTLWRVASAISILTAALLLGLAGWLGIRARRRGARRRPSAP